MDNNLMYNKILRKMLDAVKIADGDLNAGIEYDTLKKAINLSEEDFQFAMTYLTHHGYVRLEKAKTLLVFCFKHSGSIAASSEYFKNENYRLVRKWIYDGSIVICNFAVAIAAIIALNNNNINSTQIKSDVKALQSQQATIKSQLNQIQLEQLQSKNPKAGQNAVLDTSKK